MKQLMVFVTALVLLIPLARTAGAAPAVTTAVKSAGNKTHLSFKGTIQSTEIYATSFPTMSVIGSGSGSANLLSQFTISYQTQVNLLDLSETESAQLIGFNGDSIQAKGIGQATENRTPGMYNVVQIYTITSGTGRFAGASGTITLTRLVSRAVGITSSTFEGYLLLP